jgi:hypothetical protein
VFNPILNNMGGSKNMNRNLFTAWVLSLAIPGIASAQGAASPEQSGDQYNRAQVKQLERDARAPEHYKTLAGYFGERQKTYLQKAADEKVEWERRSQSIVGIQAKYPRPVDSARNLYDYYMAEAAEAARLEAKYSQLATPDVMANNR